MGQTTKGPSGHDILEVEQPSNIGSRVYGLESRVKGLGFSKVNPTMGNEMDNQNYVHTKNLGPE